MKIFSYVRLILVIFCISFSSGYTFADEKSLRYLEDQPDINDDYQIHFNYLLAADSEDREWDINGKMESIILELNSIMKKATALHKQGDGREKEYKFDYRKDGKLDITFIRLNKNHKQLKKHANDDIIPYLYNLGMNNTKKIYYNFADFSNIDGGEAGVGYGTTYLKSSSNKVLLITLHELHHTQGGGYNCIKGMNNNAHYDNQDKRVQLTLGTRLGSTYAHKDKKCPQLMDSVYLSPTSEIPYDPYKLNCLFDFGELDHPKFLKVVKKMKKAKKISWKMRFGSSCRYRDWSRGNKGFYIYGVKENILLQ